MRSTYLLVCLLHEHWHVSKNNAAPFLKYVRLQADCRTAGRELIVRVPDPKRGLEMKFRSESPATFVLLL